MNTKIFAYESVVVGHEALILLVNGSVVSCYWYGVATFKEELQFRTHKN